MIRRLFAGSLFVLACGAPLLLVAALVVRCTVHDRQYQFLLLFYMTPWPVIAAGAGMCAVYWFRHAHRFTAAWLAVLALTAGAGWLANDWQWRPTSSVRGELRLVHWNVDRPDKRQASVMRWLAAQDADLIAIAERQPKRKDTSARWRAAFPDYQLVPARGETLCLVRGEVLSVKKVLRSDGSYGTLIRTRVRGRNVTVLQADINGTPWVSRAGALKKLVTIMHQHRAENLIVVGDFNTPLDSVFIAPFRQEFSNAFETSGSGCEATWPVPFPVLSLDQVWTSPSVRPVLCQHFASWRSDHRAVLAEFDFAP
jgi:endonuclease/exonuclease/phosphatase (EEP) superfamily protein YafD